MNPRAFHQRLASALPLCIKTHAHALCAVSGGIDSVVMLHALRAISRRKNLSLRVAHVDHGLRPDSADVAQWVENLASQWGLPVATRRVKVRAIVKCRGGNIEEAARNARYAALEEMARENSAPCVAVAHHADDQAETVLHHILRGTGLAGLSGISAFRPIVAGSNVMLVRPLLGFTRKEIESYAEAQQLEYCEDSTNHDTTLTRNRIRRHLLPLLQEQFNPRVVEALVRLAGHARDATQVFNKIAADLLPTATRDAGEDLIQLDAAMLANELPGIRREALRQVMMLVGAPMQSLDQERLTAVDGLAEGDGRRRTVELPGRFAAQRRGKLLLIGKASAIREVDAKANSKRKKTKRAGSASR